MRRMMKVAETIGNALTIALLAILAWAFVYLTPPQMSAETDWLYEQMKTAE